MKRKLDERKQKQELMRNPGILLGSYRGEPVYWQLKRFLVRWNKLATHGSVRPPLF